MNSTIRTKTRRRMQRDVRLKVTVTAFGVLVLLTLIVLITHLISQSLPLALVPEFEKRASFTAPEGSRFAGSADVLERQPAMLLTNQCQVQLKSLQQQALSTDRVIIRPCDQQAQIMNVLGEHYLVTVSAKGIVRIAGVRDLHSLPTSIPAQAASGHGDFVGSSFALPMSLWRDALDWEVGLSEKWAVARVTTANQTLVRWVDRLHPTRIYDQRFEGASQVMPLPNTSQTVVYANNELRFVAPGGKTIHTVAMKGKLGWWQALPKGRSLFIASSTGEVTRWILQNQQGKLLYVPTYTLDLAQGELPTAVMSHPASNAMVIATTSKRLLLLNRLTGEIVSTTFSDELVSAISWYANRLYLHNDKVLQVYLTRHLSGVTTWASLFEKQQYEGYPEAAHTWQSSSATDYQEQKYSLVPLLMGSLKASLLALIIAIPISVCAAVYTGFFARSRLRYWIRPAIEMLEAIPSVLIGFIAAIWLAPLASNILFSFAFFMVVIPFLLVLIALFQRPLTQRLGRWRAGFELIVAVAGILLLGYVSTAIVPDWLIGIFGLDSIGELTAVAQTSVGKTTIVVAIALGIAISPSIYSLAEDAISSVPDELKQASFALGATRLQTLHNVVLYVATPGILAAVMLGFGRAFGETMIVLMVTGNTPIASWSLLEGLRALTANLAIELPEADVNSTHYQILFLTAGILFAFTFVVNTIAELLRQRLRRQTAHE